MKLSAEQFAELASSFGAVASGHKHERRRASRLDLHARVTITPVVAGKRAAPLRVAICDFSARGISFLHPTTMSAGQQFVTQISRKSGGWVHFLCTVMHSKLISDSLYRIGAEFTCTINPPPDSSDDVEQISRIRDSMLS